MFNKYFDHIYVINLDKCVERMEQTHLELSKHGILYERWSAINGYEIEIEDFKGEETSAWNNRSGALSKTTQLIIEDAIDKKYKNILIFEDDIKFIDNMENILENSMSAIPQKWDLFLFNITNEYDSIKVSKYLENIKNAWCCQAYAINSNIFETYHDELKKRDRPIDAVTIDIQKNGNGFASIPFIVSHPTNFSTLRNRVFNHTKEA
jgi:GR25 family glycosyltransferase involved in LPS biosynthesis